MLGIVKGDMTELKFDDDSFDFVVHLGLVAFRLLESARKILKKSERKGEVILSIKPLIVSKLANDIVSVDQFFLSLDHLAF